MNANKAPIIQIDPRLNLVYASYFIAGLQSIGPSKIEFNIKPFAELHQTSAEEHFDHYFCFVYADDRGSIRVAVDFRDRAQICQEALSWADVYAVVNVTADETEKRVRIDQSKEKVFPVGPSFGVNLYSYIATMVLLAKNYAKSRSRSNVGLKRRLSSYRWQLARNSIDWYQPTEKNNNYVFHASSLYHIQANGEKANLLRSEFIRAAKSFSNFEGGLVSDLANPNLDQYKDVAILKGYSQAEYANKTKQSSIVFNTPAAWGCLGWKLGEYLAFGSAIISMPLERQLPSPLNHKEHIYFVKDVGSIRCAVQELVSDETLRKRLQKNSRKYFEEICSPNIIIKRIIEKAFVNRQ